MIAGRMQSLESDRRRKRETPAPAKVFEHDRPAKLSAAPIEFRSIQKKKPG